MTRREQRRPGGDVGQPFCWATRMNPLMPAVFLVLCVSLAGCDSASDDALGTAGNDVGTEIRAKADGSLNSQYPFATRTDTTIKLHPSGASFSVPAGWIEWHNKFRNNLHLTREQIDSVRDGEGVEWDTEYAKVCNAIFSIERCCAHLGGEGWGRDAASCTDLQLRVYELATEITEVESRIASAGSQEVEVLTGAAADLHKDSKREWHQSVFTANVQVLRVLRPFRPALCCHG